MTMKPNDRCQGARLRRREAGRSTELIPEHSLGRLIPTPTLNESWGAMGSGRGKGAGWELLNKQSNLCFLCYVCTEREVRGKQAQVADGWATQVRFSGTWVQASSQLPLCPDPPPGYQPPAVLPLILLH